MSNVNLATEQLLELLLTLKKTTPSAARGILNNQPAIAYALITLMVSMNAINIEVFQRALAEFGAANMPAVVEETSSSTPTPTMVQMNSSQAVTSLSAIPPHLQQAQYRTNTPPSSILQPQTPPYGSYTQQQPQHYHHHLNGQTSSYMSTPPNHMYAQPQPQQGYSMGQYQQQQQSAQVYPGYSSSSSTYGSQSTPPVQTTSSNLADALASIPDEQKALIMRVLAMTPEQINMLPPTERSTYIQIRATLGISTG